MSSDGLYSTLPKSTREKIDLAFASIARNCATPSETSTRDLIPKAGGFLCDDQDFQSGGGFVPGHDDGGGFIRDGSEGGGFIRVEPDLEESALPTQIPLSKIPSALQILDLPPDDEEVLAVFRNAATGWASDRNRVAAGGFEAPEQYVSRDDWRSVCAVLLEHSPGENGESDGDVEMVDPGVELDDALDSDEYRESEPEAEEDDDEYIGPSVRRRTRQTQRSPSFSPQPSATSPDIRPRELTSRQRQACVEAYVLFFPSIAPEELLFQKVFIRDIQRVAKLLHEKLKTEEMVEMLETFSSSPDKSMSFDDFCRMMVSAKLA